MLTSSNQQIYGISKTLHSLHRPSLPLGVQYVFVIFPKLFYVKKVQNIFFIEVIITIVFSIYFLQTYRHPEYRGPHLGPRPSDENRRDFSEDQLRASEAIIGLQAGTNRGKY